MNTNFKVGDIVLIKDNHGYTFDETQAKKGKIIKELPHTDGSRCLYEIDLDNYPNSLHFLSNEIEKVGNQEERVTNAQGGVKADGAKLRYDLIPVACEKEIVKVLTYGATKYDDNNWIKVEPERYIGAIRRHLASFQEGEVFDPETGLHHLAHAASSLMFIMYHDLIKKGDKNG